MAESKITLLRRKLIEIDTELLKILSEDGPLSADHFERLSRCETARGSVWRLLISAENEAFG